MWKAGDDVDYMDAEGTWVAARIHKVVQHDDGGHVIVLEGGTVVPKRRWETRLLAPGTYTLRAKDPPDKPLGTVDQVVAAYSVHDRKWRAVNVPGSHVGTRGTDVLVIFRQGWFAAWGVWLPRDHVRSTENTNATTPAPTVLSCGAPFDAAADKRVLV